MQTFLPFDDYLQSALCLDRNRLNHQRTETKEIILFNLHILFPKEIDENILLSYGVPYWRYERHKNHPATLMWQKNLGNLCIYGLTICQVWSNRGYIDNQAKIIRELLSKYPHLFENTFENPRFIGIEEFHQSHKNALLFKKFDWYINYFSGEPKQEYYWPTKRGNYGI